MGKGIPEYHLTQLIGKTLNVDKTPNVGKTLKLSVPRVLEGPSFLYQEIL